MKSELWSEYGSYTCLDFRLRFAGCCYAPSDMSSTGGGVVLFNHILYDRFIESERKFKWTWNICFCIYFLRDLKTSPLKYINDNILNTNLTPTQWFDDIFRIFPDICCLICDLLFDLKWKITISAKFKCQFVASFVFRLQFKREIWSLYWSASKTDII